MNRPALINAGIALLVALAAIGGYFILLSQVNAREQEARDLSSQIQQKSSARAASLASREAAGGLAAAEAFVDARFVPEDDIVSFLEELEATGRRLGASIDIASVSDPQGGRITVALAIEGSFEAVMRTVGAIEHGSKASAAHSLTLDAIGEGRWRAAYTMEVATH